MIGFSGGRGLETRRSGPRAPGAAAVAAGLAASVLCGLPGTAGAEDAVEGRATLLVSYGLLVHFYQHDDANPYDPRFGHGVFLRLGGERCGAVCLGLSALATVPISPAGTGSVGLGPHVGFDREGPRWGGPLTFRLGATYSWHHVEEAVFASGQVSYSEPEGEHGVGAWIELTLEMLRRPSRAAPVIGLSAGYDAVLTTDPIAHVLGARLTLGLAVSRRLVFGEQEAGSADQAADSEEEASEDLTEEEERRLREAEDVLRRW